MVLRNGGGGLLILFLLAAWIWDFWPFIRLHGIDSPETRQTCTKDGKAWKCGREATAALVTRIGALAVTCKGSKADLKCLLCPPKAEVIVGWPGLPLIAKNRHRSAK